MDLYLAESYDGGETWEPNLRLSEFSSDLRRAPGGSGTYFLGDYQGIVPSLDLDTPAVACWIDTRSGNPDPFVTQVRRAKSATFAAWRSLRFSANDLARAELSGPDADPDGDGLVNLVEYALGLESFHRDPNPMSITLGKNSRDGIAMGFDRLTVASDVEFLWETSVDLRNWIPFAPQAGSGAGSANYAYLQRVVTFFHDSDVVWPDPKRFFKLRVKLTMAEP